MLSGAEHLFLDQKSMFEKKIFIAFRMIIFVQDVFNIVQLALKLIKLLFFSEIARTISIPSIDIAIRDIIVYCGILLDFRGIFKWNQYIPFFTKLYLNREKKPQLGKIFIWNLYTVIPDEKFSKSLQGSIINNDLYQVFNIALL